MKLSFVYALFIFIAIPASAYSHPAEPASAGPYDHLYVKGYFTPGSSITGKVVCPDSAGMHPVELYVGKSLRCPPLELLFFGDLYIDSIFLHKSLGTFPPSGVIEIPATLPMISRPYNLYIQAVIEGDLSNLFVMEVREYAPSGMVMIPEGDYQMGDHHDGMTDATPLHNVEVDAFLMDIHEVTNQQYCDFLNYVYHVGQIEVIGGVVYKKNDTEAFCATASSNQESRITWENGVFDVTRGKLDHPMVTVTWYGAAAYANWRSIRAGLNPCYDLTTWECHFGAGGYRLPTEAEWERAARGAEHNPYFRYPWGDIADGSKANYANSGDPYETSPPQTTPVEYYCGDQVPSGEDVANGYGLYDMAGNVWEWCNDWYDENYYSYCLLMGVDHNPTGPSSGTERVLRGGAWHLDENSLRTANRMSYVPGRQAISIGFRLVKE